MNDTMLEQNFVNNDLNWFQ